MVEQTQQDKPVYLDRVEDGEERTDSYTEAVLERHKREGLDLAVKARWVAMSIIGVFLLFTVRWPEVFYYEFILFLLCVNGWLIRRAGRVGRSKLELFLIFLDLLLMVVGIIGPTPIGLDDWPQAMQYRFGNFQYLFLILAMGTLAYSWRTVIAIGTWTAMMWAAAFALSIWLTDPVPVMSDAIKFALPG